MATDLLLPVDGCPRCITSGRSRLVHPYRLTTEGARAGVFAFYRCPECLYSWRCGWSLDALSLPCPGCQDCVPQAGVA